MTTTNTSKQSTDSTTGRDGVDVRCLVQHLDLFSGIGGFALAAKWVGGVETIGFCEIDEWAQKVLKKNFPNVPIHGDVKTLDPNNYGRIDIITGGYPCQPFSVAGRRDGEEDDRHLWPEVFRIVKQARPRWILCENVAGHISMGLDEVLSNLASENYTAEPIVIPACAIGADHRRDRVWIIANSNSERLPRRENETRMERPEKQLAGLLPSDTWDYISRCGINRGANGIPGGVDRLRGLGNAIVPQVAAEILRAMMTTDSLLNDQS